MLIRLVRDHREINETVLENDFCIPKVAFDNAMSLYNKGFLSDKQVEIWRKIIFMIDYSKVNTHKKYIYIPSVNKVTSQLELDYDKLLDESSVFEQS